MYSDKVFGFPHSSCEVHFYKVSCHLSCKYQGKGGGEILFLTDNKMPLLDILS